MAYDGKILRRAQQKLEQDRQRRADQFQMRRESAFQIEPRLREIDRTLHATMSRILSAALRKGTDPKPAIDALKQENLQLQQEQRVLLQSLRLPPDFLEERPACPLCGDTGYRNGVVCSCLRKYYAKEQQKELSRMLDLGTQSFETFSLGWYADTYDPNMQISSRKNMERILNICRKYADTFSMDSGNLLMTGDPGLGKTFLSAAIARVVSGNGWSVVYDTAGHIFGRFEDQKFRRDDGEEVSSDINRILLCDLLILDDLGTEMTTAFVQSVLYQIINTRLVEHRPTILSTNLRMEALKGRYSPQIVSRIEGEYRVLPFFGEDIRRLKKQRKPPQ